MINCYDQIESLQGYSASILSKADTLEKIITQAQAGSYLITDGL